MNYSTVMITGSSRGIGRATALRFAKEKFQVVINGAHNKEALFATQAEIIKSGGKCLAVLSDVGTYSGVNYLFEETKKTFGTVDILINNAGISYVGLLTDMSEEEWNCVIHTNLSSVFYCCKQVIPSMVHNKSGRILNISSVWGSVGASCETAYSASKGGIDSFTRALAKELAPSGIQVNAIAFGAIDTEMNQCFSKEELHALAQEIPVGRFASKEEAADYIFESVTHTSPYLTGQILRFDGGWI